MRLRTTLQLASFFPIFLVALFVVYLFTVYVAGGTSGDGGSVFPVVGVSMMGVLALLAGWGFYRMGDRLVAQIGALKSMAERVRHGDLTPAVQLAGGEGSGVATVTEVFSELVVELRGYVELIGAHETLKREFETANEAARRLREAAVPVSGALELLRRAERGIIECLLADDRFLFSWLPPGTLRDALGMSGDANGLVSDSSVPSDIQDLLRERVSSPSDGTGDDEEALPHTVSVKDALAASMRLCQWTWARSNTPIEVTLDCSTSGPFDVCAERLGLVETFAAVLQNGAEAMPEGGTIKIELGTDSSGTVTVAMTDTGIGMSEVVRSRCMRPFFSTREDRLGMGLTLAAHLVARWEGRMGIISEPGQGATVHMTFPRSHEQAGDKAGDERSRGPVRVLLVEDDEATRETLTKLLEQDEHSVTAVEDGPAAILALRDKRFDVVLTDRAMPIMTGDELAVAVKARRAETAVVMVTGMGDEMERLHQQPEGVDVVLAKPVLREDLQRGIARALEIAGMAR